jgi:hypothetical protein
MSLTQEARRIAEFLGARMHQMCSRGILVVVAAAVAAVVEGCQPGSRAKADYTIQQRAEFLQESVAVEKALQTLVQFFPTNRWEVQAYSQTTAPDKSPDKNLLRNRKNANRGTVHFLDRQASIDKVVAVELLGTNLSCEVLRSK